MNRIFKSVWSEALGAWVAASEKCRGRGKGGAKAVCAVLVAVGLSVGSAAFAAGPGTELSVNASTTTANATDIAIGSNASAQSKTRDAIAIGDAAKSTADSAIAIGANVTDNAANSILMGNGGTMDAGSTKSVFFAPNGGNVTNSANSFVFTPYGGTATSNSSDSINIGGLISGANYGVAIGSKASVSVDSDVAIGANASAESVNSVAIGANSKAVRANTVSVGSAAGQRQIVQVSNGTQATDAVNVSQIQGVLEAIGGGADIDSKTGLITDPTYIINGVPKTGIGAAMIAINNSLGDAVMYDGVKDSVTLGGTAGTQIHNLAAGAVDQDAVNLKQLKDAGAIIDSTGTVTNAFVAYDSTSRDSVTLGGSSGTQIHNLAAGAVDQDAVNLKQLKDAGAIIDSTGTVTNAFVAYDSTAKDSVTLGGSNGTQIHNLAAGAVDQDAVNLKQLKDAGAIIDSTGTVTNAFVTYDSTAKDSVTLGGSNGTQIHNLAAGAVDQDAVNLKQLKDAGAIIDSTGAETNAFVAYDSTSKDSVTLRGSNGTQIHKLAAGVADQDAVNVKQLTDAGLIVDSTGTPTNAFVAYDSMARDSITLRGANGTVIHNVANGAVSATSKDAVNGSQLFEAMKGGGGPGGDSVNYDSPAHDSVTFGMNPDQTVDAPVKLKNVAAGEVSVTSSEAVNGAQLYGTAASTAAALGGGASVDANGAVTAPTYTVGGVDTHDVGTALNNIDARTTKNTTDISNIQTDVTNITVATRNAISYDSDSHDKVTLGGTDAVADGGVVMTNVKAGNLSATSTDAVNGSQLNATNVRIDTFEGVVNNFVTTGSPYVAVNSSTATSSPPTATGTDAVAIGANASASGNNAVAIGSNSIADEANTASVGSAGNERRVTNVAPGQNGTDAANMNQLSELRSDLGQSVTDLSRAAFGGVASAMAMPNLTPSQPGKTVAAVGIGNYKGYTAVGAGATYRSRDGAWLVNGALSITPHGDAGMRAQVGYEF